MQSAREGKLPGAGEADAKKLARIFFHASLDAALR